MIDIVPVPWSCTKSIGASATAAVCSKHAAVSCVAAGCDWSNESHAHRRTRCRYGSEPFRRCLDTHSIRRYGLIDFKSCLATLKSSSHGTVIGLEI